MFIFIKNVPVYVNSMAMGFLWSLWALKREEDIEERGGELSWRPGLERQCTDFAGPMQKKIAQ